MHFNNDVFDRTKYKMPIGEDSSEDGEDYLSGETTSTSHTCLHPNTHSNQRSICNRNYKPQPSYRINIPDE